MSNKNIKDESWSATCGQTKEFIDTVLGFKPNDPELNLVFWILDQLTARNEKVLVAVDENDNYIVKNKTLTIYDLSYKVEADKLDKHKKVSVPFWELIDSTNSKGMRLCLAQSKHRILYSAIYYMYGNSRKLYIICKSIAGKNSG